MSFDTAKLKRDFERSANTYDDVAGLQRMVLHELLEPQAALLRSGTVLDAGCGTGALLGWLKNQTLPSALGRGQGDGVIIVPLDLAFAMCLSASAKQDVPRAVNANIESLCFADNSFDVVVSSLALQWVNDRDAAFAEFYRVLKPGGVLLLSSFGPDTLHELKTAFSVVDSHVHVSSFVSREYYARSAECAGFSIMKNDTRMQRQQIAGFGELLKQLKSLGAGNKWKHRRPGMTTRGQLAQVEARYTAQFGAEGLLPVTWEIITMECRK